MVLSPRERADFEAIVTRLRMEDAAVDVVRSKRRLTALVIGVLIAALVCGLGVVLVEHEPTAFRPVLVAAALVGGMTVALRACVRSR